MEVPKLGVKLELQLPAYTTTTAMLDPVHICDLLCSLEQCQILHPLSEGRDRTLILVDGEPRRELQKFFPSNCKFQGANSRASIKVKNLKAN